MADPKFVDAAYHDFRLRDDSPARKLGIQSLDASQAGRGEPPVLTRDLPPVPRAFDSRRPRQSNRSSRPPGDEQRMIVCSRSGQIASLAGHRRTRLRVQYGHERGMG